MARSSCGRATQVRRAPTERTGAESKDPTIVHAMGEPVSGDVDFNDPHRVPPCYDVEHKTRNTQEQLMYSTSQHAP
ncbi:uncharacterized protein RMCN_4040 [Mycolicibacterium novocastrense]|uniref:Uncharacterized protein n=1 Tax=Mycolicibacterium novocastrense TaxID=59813 RepID=A0ABQ0KMU3_MYCNV|nr:uncharacterized protein RMCN_4040 [Mycolicibacterium novocastrense]